MLGYLSKLSIRATVCCLFCFYFFAGTAFSQSQEKRILNWQNFKKSIETTVITDPVVSGRFTIFEITEINKFLYKVEITGKKVELQTPIPTELQQLFRLSTTDLKGTQGETKAEKGISDVESAKEPMKEILNSTMKAAKRLAGEEDPQNEEELKKKNELVSFIKDLLSKCDEYISKSRQINNKIIDLRIIRSQLISLSQEDFGHSVMASKVDEINPPAESTVKNIFNELMRLYDELESLYEQAKEKVPEKDKAAVEDALDKVESGHKKITEDELLKLIEDVTQLSEGLKNEKNFIVTAPPVQMDGDFVSYEVSITPTRTNTLGVYRNPIQFVFDIPARQGWKADFSVGPVVSFGNNAKDDNYFLDQAPSSDNVFLRKRDNNNSISPSLAALMHFYPRSGKNAAFGGLFGVGAGFQNVEAINFNILAGVSLVVGKRQKIMFNTGVSYLRVNRLKSGQFKVDSEYKPSTISLDTITEKVFKPSFFLSISYNLTNRIEIN